VLDADVQHYVHLTQETSGEVPEEVLPPPLLTESAFLDYYA
jgi:hypothetical protein